MVLNPPADILTSGLVLVGMTIAARPPDQNHPYGHGRVEILTGLLLGFVLFGAGLLIALHNGLDQAPVRVPVPPAAYAVWPMVISIVMKSGLVTFKARAAKRFDSSALRADAANDGVDIVSGFVAIVRAAADAATIRIKVPSRGSLRCVRGGDDRHRDGDSRGLRSGHAPDGYDAGRYRDGGYPQGGGYGAGCGGRGESVLRGRPGRLKYHVDLHLEVDPEITVRASHDIAQRVRERVCELLPWVADVLVHVEPAPGKPDIRH